jgi:hypothetical protein
MTGAPKAYRVCKLTTEKRQGLFLAFGSLGLICRKGWEAAFRGSHPYNCEVWSHFGKVCREVTLFEYWQDFALFSTG